MISVVVYIRKKKTIGALTEIILTPLTNARGSSGTFFYRVQYAFLHTSIG